MSTTLTESQKNIVDNFLEQYKGYPLANHINFSVEDFIFIMVKFNGMIICWILNPDYEPGAFDKVNMLQANDVIKLCDNIYQYHYDTMLDNIDDVLDGFDSVLGRSSKKSPKRTGKVVELVPPKPKKLSTSGLFLVNLEIITSGY